MAFSHTFLIVLVCCLGLSIASNACVPQQPHSILQGDGALTINIYNGCYDVNQNNKNCKLPNGYTYIEGVGAHKLHTETKTFNEARKICIEEGAHLAVINSAEEEKLFEKAAHDLKADQIWIGMHDLFKEGDWVTVLDKPVKSLPYTHWILDNPNNESNGENCGTYWRGGWNDAFCTVPHPFFCEIDLEKNKCTNFV